MALNTITPDVVSSLSFTYALTVTGKSTEIREDAKSEIGAFFHIKQSFEEKSPEWFFLSRIEAAVITAGGSIAGAIIDYEDEVRRAKSDFNNRIRDGVVVNRLRMAAVLLLFRVLFIMGFGYVMTQLGLGIADVTVEKQEDLEWLPMAVAFTGPVLLNLFKDLWKAITLSGHTYNRDRRIHRAKIKKYNDQMAAIHFALEVAREAIKDFTIDWQENDSRPTLRLLTALRDEELSDEITPPLLVMITESVRRIGRKIIRSKEPQAHDHPQP